MTETWRLIENPPGAGAWNMAVDMALVQSAQEQDPLPTLRFYGWSRPTLSYGYAQKPEDWADLSFMRNNGISLVRRPTGGRAMFHDDEVTYSVVVPVSSAIFGSLREIHGRISSVMTMALSECGVEIDPVDRDLPSGLSTACCFASKTRYEITSGGRKIAGNAQRRLKGAALQHGSIVLSIDADRYLSCFKWKDRASRETARGCMGAVNDSRITPMDPGRLREAIIKSFERLFDICFKEGRMSQMENQMARRMYDSGAELEGAA